MLDILFIFVENKIRFEFKYPYSHQSTTNNNNPISHRVPLPSFVELDFGTFWDGFWNDFGWNLGALLDPVTSFIDREKGRGPDREAGKSGRGPQGQRSPPRSVDSYAIL